ncbi:MAG: 4-hydroxythreonine-4-phosphate dehydrogenase PdxA [Gammaproteobacteria bacterium]
MHPSLILSAGEPAGIGPEICLSIARSPWPARLCVVADADLMAERAAALNYPLTITRIDACANAPVHTGGTLHVVHEPLSEPARAGTLDALNAGYVLRVLDRCTDACLDGSADAMVTAPLHKGIVNDAGIAFSGHTEYLAERTGAALPVMMLCAGTLRVALATTHLPLKDVSAALTAERVDQVVRIVDQDLKRWFGIDTPAIGVCGLNPHAGEGGHLGSEEQTIIEPVLDRARIDGLKVIGPLPADTAFTPRILDTVDAVLAMYHDQGLPVLKYAGFGEAINLTLGLPILRTSVDHGTALDLAGTGNADDGSLRAALSMAIELVASRVN